MAIKNISGTIATSVILNDYPGYNQFALDATISAGNFSAVYGNNSQSWTVTNNGIVVGYGGVDFAQGGQPSFVANNGTIAGSAASGTGIFLESGGKIVNRGLITGPGSGIFANSGGPVTIANYGAITGTGASGTGVSLQSGGAIANHGTIAGSGNSGVYLTGGSLTNGAPGATAALIAGSGTAIFTGTAASSVIINFGTIAASGTNGFGVFVQAPSSTLVNAGTISGSTSAATLNGKSDLLVVYPQAVFVGTVAGAAGDTIELVAGSGIGSIELGTQFDGYPHQFTGFTGLTVNPGAVWQVTESDAEAMALQNSGTIVVTNGGLLALSSDNAESAGAGTIDLESRSTVDEEGAVAAGQTLRFLASTGTLLLEAPGKFAGSIVGFQAGDALELADTPATSFVYSGSSAAGTLTVMNGNTAVASLALSGGTNYSQAAFALAQAGGNVSVITLTPSSPAPQRNLLFNLVYDQSVANAPAGFLAVLNQSIQFFEQNFTDPITFNLEVGWDEIENGGPIQPGVSEGGTLGDASFTYAQVKAQLAADAKSAAQQTAVANLPANDPAGSDNFLIGRGEEEALGLISGTASGLDGAIGMTQSPTQPFLISADEHEIAHAMGRVADMGQDGFDSPLDLFRYTSPGTPALAAVNNVYFSINGGQTQINQFATTSDLSDWSGLTPDSFNAFGGGPVSQGDLVEMNVLGFQAGLTSNPVLMTNPSGAVVFDQVFLGQMNFTTIGGLGAEWEFDGSGLFMGDDNTGFLIRDAGSVAPGAIYVGEVVNGSASFIPIGGLGLEWQFEGNADFLGTGQTEFLIRNTGAAEPGALDLGQVVNGAASFIPLGGLGLEWQFDGTGDFLGDGRNGFLIRNTGSAEPGALDVGEIVNGAVQYTPIGGLGTEWNFEGTGDFLGDGHTSFLIWNSGSADPGAMAIGEVVNGQLTFTDIGGVGPEWQFVGVGNFIDMTKTDFLLHNSGSGALAVGAVTNGTAGFTIVGAVGQEWNFHVGSPALLA